MFGNPYKSGAASATARPLFLYGTLRPGSWNHERWMAPFLARPCRPATLTGYALHLVGGLPYLVATTDAVVTGDLADLDPDRYESTLALLDEFEGTHDGHYRRVVVTTDAGEEAWAWLAGDDRTADVGAATLVPSGDWLEVDAG